MVAKDLSIICNIQTSLNLHVTGGHQLDKILLRN
jgi:hypothetical protein